MYFNKHFFVSREEVIQVIARISPYFVFQMFVRSHLTVQQTKSATSGNRYNGSSEHFSPKNVFGFLPPLHT